MTKRRCIPCGGSGRVMGGGMLMTDCDHCDGIGKVVVIEDEIETLLAKNTEHYNNAKEKIKALDKSVTEEMAVEILDKEIESQKNVKPIFQKSKKRDS